MHYSSIFHQLFNFIPRHRFENAVKNTSGDLYCKHFTAWKQFLTLLYAQISGKDSLREIENGLLANHKRLYHLGMEVVPKSTLAEAMNRRSPEMEPSGLYGDTRLRAARTAPGGGNHGLQLSQFRRYGKPDRSPRTVRPSLQQEYPLLLSVDCELVGTGMRLQRRCSSSRLDCPSRERKGLFNAAHGGGWQRH